MKALGFIVFVLAGVGALTILLWLAGYVQYGALS